MSTFPPRVFSLLLCLASASALVACESPSPLDAAVATDGGLTSDANVTDDAGLDAGSALAIGSMFEAAAAREGSAVDMEELFWHPEEFDALYPSGGSGTLVRTFAPPCIDGSNPVDRVCPGGEEPVRCADGTRPVYYFRPGTTNRWIIRVQNGGVACHVDYGDLRVTRAPLNCWNLYQYGDSSARQAFTSTGSRERMSLDGIYRDGSANPFTEYNVITLDKCVGDRNLGDATVADYQYLDERDVDAPIVEHVGPVYFHGYRILEAILRGLAHDDAAPPLELVAFQTHSNGSRGQYMYIDRLAELVRSLEPGAEVRGITTGMIRPAIEVEATADDFGVTHADAAYDSLGSYLDLGLHARLSDSPGDGQWLSPGLFTEGGLEHARNVGWGTLDETPTLDASCLAAHPDDEAPCLDPMHVVLNHLSTPIFVAAQQRDPVIRTSTHLINTNFDLTERCDPGAACCHDENFPAGEDCTTFPDRPSYPIEGVEYSVTDFADRVLSTVRAMREGFETRSEMRPGCVGSSCDASPLPSPRHAAFIDDTTDHFSVQQDERAGAMIDGRRMAEYLYDWLATGVDTWCVDVSGEGVATSGTGAAWGVCPAP